ncbi:hypothetical protein SAMN02910436_02902 [Ruminococcaceae bacterium P7]|nr:hypothetical protein SAMN02910436_02902 [Ruminococcaceae bacterium P7]
MNQPTISQYLLSTCLFTIDELNEQYCRLTKDELKRVADEEFNEMDITVRLGYPFKQMVHYTVGDSKRQNSKVNHDLYVRSKDFKIEIKYLKNWKSGIGTNSASKTWSEYQKDFDWLIEEIKQGHKHKRAFVIGWFNCVDSISRYLQLGTGGGSKPLVNENRLAYFPFLRRLKAPTHTTDLLINYDSAYKELSLNLIGEEIGPTCNCIFLGNENDVFHFAIFY